jgi:hypothetical protein
MEPPYSDRKEVRRDGGAGRRSRLPLQCPKEAMSLDCLSRGSESASQRNANPKKGTEEITMNARTRVSLLAGLVLALGLVRMTPASADVVFNERLPFAFTVFNDCTGEYVDLAGIFHAVVIANSLPGGGYRFDLRLDAHGEGVGQSSRNQYVWNDTIHESFNAASGCDFDDVYDRHLRLISKGSLPNLLLRVKFEFGATGCAYFFNLLKSSLDCRG